MQLFVQVRGFSIEGDLHAVLRRGDGKRDRDDRSAEHRNEGELGKEGEPHVLHGRGSHRPGAW